MKKFALILFLILSLTGIAFAQQEVIIQGQDDKGVPRAVSTDTDGRMVGQVSVIDGCEVVPGWTALSNDTTNIETDLDHVMGAKSLEFAKIDGGDNLTVGGIQKVITAVNLAFLIENGGAFGYSLNVSATTDIDYCFLRLGTDVSNYNEWRVEGTGLSVGWNSLRFNTNAPATAGATGNGWDPEVVQFIALGCNFKLETDALADIRVDHIVTNVGLQVAADINASVSSSSSATKVDLAKVLGTATDIGIGAAGLGTQRVSVSTDDIVSVSDDDNANTIGNPIYIQVSQDGTNAVDATHPVPISKDMAANATGNRIWVKSDVDMVLGTATNVNGGNRDAGTQTIAVADNDPVAVSVAHLDAWDDGVGRAKVNVERDIEIDNCDVTTGWAAANDATGGLAASANHVDGSGSLVFNKVNGTGFTEGYIEKTLSSINLVNYQVHDILEWSVYISDLTDVAYAFLRLGDDNANYSEWRVLDDDLTAGAWNPIAMFAGNVEYTVVGTGLNSADVDYVAVGVSFDLEDDLLAGIGIDAIHAHGSAHSTASITSEVSTSVNTANVNLLKVGNKIVDKDIGNSGDGTQRVVNATDDPNLSKLTVEDLDTTGATDNRQVVAIVTESATGAVLNSAAAPMFTSGVSTGGTSSMTATGPTAVSPGPVLVLAAQDITQAASWGFVIFNNGGGGNPLTDADVQVSRDGGVTYYPLTWTACDNLADADDCDYDYPFNSFTHMLVYTTSAVGTSVTVQFSALAR